MTYSNRSVGLLGVLFPNVESTNPVTGGSSLVGGESKLPARTQELVEKGLALEQFYNLHSKRLPRRAGAPRKNPKLSNDAKRAFLLYAVAERIREVGNHPRSATIEMPTKKMIELAEKLFDTHGLFNKNKADNKLYQGVKRGRVILGIDAYWRGKPMDKILR